MGYYTRHALGIKSIGKFKEEEEVRGLLLPLLDKYEVLDYALDEGLDSYDGVKWYDHEIHMRAISTAIGNDVILLLEGEGEEQGDIWKEYYSNGKMARYTPKLMWENFKQEDLK